MKTILCESVRKDAIQKYGEERVNAILMRDNVLGLKYLIPICKFVYEEGVDVNEVFDILNRMGNKKIGNIWNMTFQELKDAYELNFPCDIVPLPNTCFNTPDNMIQIGHITSWEEAKKIPMNRSWCISRTKEKWDEYTLSRHYRFYIIRNLNNSYSKAGRYVLLAISPNGSYDFSDSTDVSMTEYCITPNHYKGHLRPSEYKQTLGEDAIDAIEKIVGRRITETKIQMNMKKNVQRINESRLRAIVAESVKKVLREGYGEFEAESTAMKSHLINGLSEIGAAINEAKKCSDVYESEMGLLNEIYDKLDEYLEDKGWSQPIENVSRHYPSAVN